jgi:hypothetical protein
MLRGDRVDLSLDVHDERGAAVRRINPVLETGIEEDEPARIAEVLADGDAGAEDLRSKRGAKVLVVHGRNIAAKSLNGQNGGPATRQHITTLSLGAEEESIMHREDIPKDLEQIAFDFFYWFSRFEFALKENHFLKAEEVGAPAEPGWDAFVSKHEGGYQLSAAAIELVVANPERQVVGVGDLEFRPVGFDDRPSDLGKVVRLAKTVRNNLFHGGKHGAGGWDNPDRMRKLLPLVVKLLGELASMGDIENDYLRSY